MLKRGKYEWRESYSGEVEKPVSNPATYAIVGADGDSTGAVWFAPKPELCWLFYLLAELSFNRPPLKPPGVLCLVHDKPYSSGGLIPKTLTKSVDRGDLMSSSIFFSWFAVKCRHDGKFCVTRMW